VSNIGKRIYRLNRTLHRDIGHLLVGLTLLFAISGIALNHLHDWNPNYKITNYDQTLSNLPQLEDDMALGRWVSKKLEIKEKLRHVHASSPLERVIFFPNARVELNLATGKAKIEQTIKRPLLFPLNQMHLNRAGTWWIYLADIYGVLLIFLAISGVFMAKGLRKSIKRRGYILLFAGIILPIIYWIFLSSGGASGS
jgi:uncharacterized protein